MISHESQSRRRFWTIPRRATAPRPLPDQHICDEYADLFADAVRLRLRSDVPVGTCLSGGLDSSSIVATVARARQSDRGVSPSVSGQTQHTFSAIYDSTGPWNEESHIRKVARHTDATPHYVRPSAADLWSQLDDMVWHQDEPFQSTSIFAQWCVMRLAHRTGVTVLLDGQGADELLGGYGPFGVHVADLLAKARIATAIREMRLARSVTGLNLARPLAYSLIGRLPGAARVALSDIRMRQSIETSGLRGDLRERLSDWMHEEGGAYPEIHHLHNMEDHLAYLVTEQLPNLLRHEDRNSMAFSIEARVPFLDYRLVEFVFTTAAHLRLRGGWTKWLQRMAVAPYLPESVVWRRDKVGFETPEVAWFQASQSYLSSLLSSENDNDYLDLDYARARLPELVGDARGTRKLWRWINVVSWLRLHCHAPTQAA